jgi:hypothetical protein
MNKYTDTLSLRTLRILDKAISLGGACSLLGMVLLSLQSGSGLASQMPWYFWVLALCYYLSIFYTPPPRLGIARTETPTDVAWFLVACAVLTIGFTLFMLIFLPLGSSLVIFVGLSLSLGVRGARALLWKRQQSNHLSAPG